MTVSAVSFQRWLDVVAPAMSHAAVCRGAGIKRSTLAQQVVRGRVSVATVVAVSRSRRLSVVESLSVFPDYRDVAAGVAQPTDAELLSQISDMDLLREVLARSASAESGTDDVQIEFSPIPHRASVRAWLDAIGPSGLRQQLCRSTGIAPQNLSTQISANRLTPGLAICCARIAGVGLANGLVATGLITSVEAGWAPGSRAEALRQTANSALVELAAERMDALSRTLRRREQDAAAAESVWENIG
ncbi:hypothetical protein [Arthrobacter sp.]|uniref:hypothetical protein n=1 Tax=Arthrobacter sp. TaxID=1667 RepID=UPI002588E32B|nr:hypothetical protein [Arthrobacter sp.]